MLAEDRANAKPTLYNEENKDSGQFPRARGGHSMSVIGNPRDYMLVFGGSGVEYVDDKDSESGIKTTLKETLNDFWVFNINANLW